MIIERSRLAAASVFVGVLACVAVPSPSPAAEWVVADATFPEGKAVVHLVSDGVLIDTINMPEPVVSLAMDHRRALAYAGIVTNKLGVEPEDPGVYVIDLITRNVVGELPAGIGAAGNPPFADGVLELALSPDGTRLYSQGLRMWDLASGTLVRPFHMPAPLPQCHSPQCQRGPARGKFAITADETTAYVAGVLPLPYSCDSGPRTGHGCFDDQECAPGACRKFCSRSRTIPCSTFSDCPFNEICGLLHQPAAILRVDLTNVADPQTTGFARLDLCDTPDVGCPDVANHVGLSADERFVYVGGRYRIATSAPGWSSSPTGAFVEPVNDSAQLLQRDGGHAATVTATSAYVLEVDPACDDVLLNEHGYNVHQDCCESSAVAIDLASWTTTARVPMPGTTGAIAPSLDGSEVYAAYLKPCAAGFYEGACRPRAGCSDGHVGPSGGGALAILDTASNQVIGSVSDAEGRLDWPRTVVDPYVPASKAARKCTMKKRKAAGKAAGRILKCYTVAKTRAQPVDAKCLAVAATKLDSEILRAGTSCPGDASTLAPLVDACVADALADVPGDGPCPGGSIKYLGKALAGQMVCSMKDLTKPGTLGGCSATRDAKLELGLSKSGLCAGPSTVSHTHACRDALAAAVPVVEP